MKRLGTSINPSCQQPQRKRKSLLPIIFCIQLLKLEFFSLQMHLGTQAEEGTFVKKKNN